MTGRTMSTRNAKPLAEIVHWPAPGLGLVSAVCAAPVNRGGDTRNVSNPLVVSEVTCRRCLREMKRRLKVKRHRITRDLRAVADHLARVEERNERTLH